MAKSKTRLPLGEVRLLAWRMGMKLGSAIDRHRHAHWHLRQKDLASVESSKPDIHVPSALANEIGMMQDFDACLELAKTIGVTLAPLEGSEECRKLFYRGNKLSPEEAERLPVFIETVDKRVETAYEGLKEHLRQRDEMTAALFDVAVRASLCVTSPDDPANLSRLAVTADIPVECTMPFLAALSAKADPELQRKELARMDKCVERDLLKRL